MVDAYLRLVSVDNAVLFDCVHNGSNWVFEWTAYGFSDTPNHTGSCLEGAEMFPIVREIAEQFEGSRVEGHFAEDYEKFIKLGDNPGIETGIEQGN